MVTGVGKGITGYLLFSFFISPYHHPYMHHYRLVTKPLAGVFDMGVKTTQGVINTPGTLARNASKLTISFDSNF